MKGTRSSLFAALSTAGLVTVLLAGSSAASARTVRKAAPHTGGTIVYALPPQTNVPWYFPYTNNANASYYTALLGGLQYPSVVYVDDQEQLDWKDSLARAITYNRQGTVFHVFLHTNWRWSDGSPVTAQDCVFGYDVLAATDQSTQAPWPNSDLGSGNIPGNVKSVAANSPTEFTITLKKPANQEWFIYNGIQNIIPLPMQTWDRYPHNIKEEITYLGKNATNPSFNSVVDGPFKMTDAVQNQSWTFVPNPDYGGHRPYVSKLVVAYEGSDTSEFAALKTGQVQIGYLPSSLYGARAELPDRMIPEYRYAFAFTWVNMEPKAEGGVNAIFDNLYVRQAMFMAMDDSAITNVIYHGYGAAQYGPIPQVPKTRFLDPSLAKPLYPYNVAAGKKLLEAHGWHEVKGVMTKGGQTMAFTLIYPSGDLAETETAEILQQSWGQEGIHVTLDPQPFATLVGDLSTPNKWQMVTGINILYGGLYPSGENFFYKLQGLDENGWNNAEENRLVQATISPAPSEAVNMARFYAYEMYTAKELPALWMPNIADLDEVAPTVHGYDLFTADPVTGGMMPQYWWVSP